MFVHLWLDLKDITKFDLKWGAGYLIELGFNPHIYWEESEVIPHQDEISAELMNPVKPADPRIQDHWGPASNTQQCFDSLWESS